MKKILLAVVFILSGLLTACGGGSGGGTGSGDPPPPTQPTNVALQVSTTGSVPTDKIIRSIYTVITIPSTVTIKTIGNALDVTIPAEFASTVTTSATLIGSDLTLSVLSTDPNGLPPGLFAIVNCYYTGTTTPIFSQPTNAVVAGGPAGTFDVFDNLGMGVSISIQ